MEKKSKAEKFWDMLANKFDERAGYFEQTHIKTVENTKAHLKAGDVVLDYGCATGTVAVEIAGWVKEVHGIDISSKMIEAAKTKAAERGIENVDFAQSTIFDAGYEAGSFDAVLALNILHLLEDADKAVQRINELLKPGGMFISATASIGEKKSFLDLLLLLLVKLGIVPYMGFYKIPEIEELITAAGFQVIHTERLTLGNYFVAARKV